MNDAAVPERLSALGDELMMAAKRLVAARKRRARAMRTGALVAASTLAVAAGALAAERIFGDPAPDTVKRDIAAVDAGLPAEIRLNPHVTEAYSVAESDTAILYYARLDDGGYCTQLVINGREHAAACLTAAQASALPIAVTISTPDPGTTMERLTVGGRVNSGPADHLEVHIGTEVRRVAMGDEGFFAFDLSPSDVIAARSSGLSIEAVDSSGHRVAANNLTDVFAEGPPVPQPIEITYRSGERDLSLLLGLDGRVNDPTIKSLELQYPDGHRQEIELRGEQFHLRITGPRQDDFATAMGHLVGRDAAGNIVAQQRVASVAFFRGVERSGRFERSSQS